MATGLMAIAKVVKGKTSIEAREVSTLVGVARDAMMSRGKADLGGKTVLDSLDAVALATDGLSISDEIADAASGAVSQAMDALRQKPATIGRARIFAEKSIGMDDPGMVAMKQIVNAIADR
jgi:dihydroxyacetone kinase-like protein